LTEKKQQQDK